MCDGTAARNRPACLGQFLNREEDETMKLHRVFRFAPLAFLLGAILPIAGLDGSARAVPPAANSQAEARQTPIDLFDAADAGESVGLGAVAVALTFRKPPARLTPTPSSATTTMGWRTRSNAGSSSR